MTKTTARPAQLAPVRIGNGVKVHLGHLSSIKGPNGEPRYCSYCPASAGRDGTFTAGEAIAEEIDCRSCQRQASADALERAADTAEAMFQATTLNREYDHNGQCVGCGALGTISHPAGGPGVARDEPCAPECGFETGTVSPAMILRAAVSRLDRFPRGHGADLRAALNVAAVALVRTEDTRGAGEDLDVEDLVQGACDALGAYFDEAAGPDAIPGAELVDEYGAVVPRRMLAETLYLAADRHDGAEFHEITRERLICQALRELCRSYPDAETVQVTITGPEDGPHKVEFLALANPNEVYVTYGWSTAAEEDAFDRATELIVRALTVSLPPYLRAIDDAGDATHEFAIADTTYGQTRQR